jgi:hypothetical protein
VKEKRNRRIKEKGLLPRPNSSWVVGRTGFGPMGYRKVTGPIVHEGGLSGVYASLGHNETPQTRQNWRSLLSQWVVLPEL